MFSLEVIISKAFPDLPKDTRVYWCFAHFSYHLVMGECVLCNPFESSRQVQLSAHLCRAHTHASRAGGASECLIRAPLSTGCLTSWQFTVVPGVGVGVCVQKLILGLPVICFIMSPDIRIRFLSHSGISSLITFLWPASHIAGKCLPSALNLAL